MEVNRQVAGIKANDDAVLKAIYVSNFAKVEDFIMRNNGSAEDAKDTYQEAFVAAWRNIHMNKFEPQNESALSGYIYQIAKNKWLDHLRAAKNRKVHPLQDSNGQEPADDTTYQEKEAYFAAIDKHFRRLGEQCRELLKRFYFEKASLREIAATFAWTEASTKNNKYRCLKKLRDMVTGQKNEAQ
jgi:RNA polymerase sigma factor (sigma-70 family)